MSLPLPFPEDLLEDIRQFDGNNKCCDCPSLDTDWASVTHGTLICLDCAGKHRSLGVHVSFVRSITMDTWSPLQIEMLKQGGNAQIRRFFRRLEIENSPLQTLYCTKAAEHYREKLRERVEKVISGEIVAEKRSRSERSKPQHPTSPPLPPPSSKTITANIISAIFNAGPMGMTLTKDFRDQAYVSKLVPGGQAQQQGIAIGDIVISVAGKAMGSYDEIMHMIPLMPRPLELNLTRIETSPAKSEPIHQSKSETALLSIHRPAAGGLRDSGLPSVPTPVHVPAIRSTKLNIEVHSSSSNTAKSSHPMQKATKAVVLLRKGMKGVEIVDDGDGDDDEDNNSIIEDFDEEDHHDIDTSDNIEEIVDEAVAKESISFVNGDDRNGENASETNHNASQDSTRTRNPLEPGSVIKVLKSDSGKWKTAMIKRRHKDNTFKVIYKDGTEESHVPVSRLAMTIIPKETSPQIDTSSTADVIISQRQRSAYEEALLESLERDRQDINTDENTTDFIVESEENLDAWIERDFKYEISSVNVTSENSYFVTKDVVSSSSSNSNAKDRIAKSIDGGDLVIDFPAAPLGLTLSTNLKNEAEVIRIREGGNAAKEGVQIGDIVIMINGVATRNYEEAMQIMGSISFPVTINFRRPPKSVMADSGDVLLRNSKIIATQLMDTMGLSKDSILTSNKNSRLANSRISNSTNTGSGIVANSSSSAPRRLELNPGINQFDIQFEQPEMGFRVQERLGAQIASVVTDVTDKGEAKSKGLTVGCVIIGINFEPYLSHAHTVATLKYVKRPVLIRFARV